MTRPLALPTARDIMVRDVITLDPDTPLIEAIRILLRSGISGAPVVDAAGTVVGVLSELDCLRTFAADEYSAEDSMEAASVRTLMNAEVHTIAPDLELYGIVQRFTALRVRRLPVVSDGQLVGQVSRRDALRAIDGLRDARLRPARPGPTGLYLSATDTSPDAIANRLQTDHRRPAPPAGEGPV